jgi:hypothetical protein
MFKGIFNGKDGVFKGSERARPQVRNDSNAQAASEEPKPQIGRNPQVGAGADDDASQQHIFLSTWGKVKALEEVKNPTLKAGWELKTFKEMGVKSWEDIKRCFKDFDQYMVDVKEAGGQLEYQKGCSATVMIDLNPQATGEAVEYLFRPDESTEEPCGGLPFARGGKAYGAQQSATGADSPEPNDASQPGLDLDGLD